MSTEKNTEFLFDQSVKILTDLIGFKTVSGEDNSSLIDYCDDILKRLGATSFRTYDDEKKESIYLQHSKLRVQTIKNLTIVNKSGTSSGYSEFAYDIDGGTIDNVLYPSLDPSIFELRFPDIDIQGRVVTN